MTEPKIFIWNNLADLDLDQMELRAELTSDQRSYYSTITHAKRRREWLASRIMALEELGQRISREESGRPIVDDGYVSISHTDNCVVLTYCEDGVCGVDIETITRVVDRISHRFATAQECEIAREVLPENPNLVVWCAKEAAYKILGRVDVEFISDLKLVARDQILAFGQPIELIIQIRGSFLVVIARC